MTADMILTNGKIWCGMAEGFAEVERAIEANNAFSDAVDTAVDGRQAVSRARDTDYALILMDVQMPHMDGLTLCKQIKDDPALKELPVLLFSSLITDKLRHKGEAVGADDQISKPEVTRLAQKAIDLIKQRKWA